MNSIRGELKSYEFNSGELNSYEFKSGSELNSLNYLNSLNAFTSFNSRLGGWACATGIKFKKDLNSYEFDSGGIKFT